MVRTKRFLQVAAAACILVLLVGVAQRVGCRSGVPNGQAKGEVTFVYDGDTAEVSGAGKVRLLGIDTLDSRNRSKLREQARHLQMERGEVTRWARRAEAFVRKKLAGERVRLEVGHERRGDYGRLLAYLYIDSGEDEVNFNRLLLEKGLATAYRAFDYRLKKEFLRAEKKARKQDKGLWQDARSTW